MLTTEIKEMVSTLYQLHRIDSLEKLNPEEIALRFGIDLIYLPSASFYCDGVIVLGEQLSCKKKWQLFGHELGHACLHSGNQLLMDDEERKIQEREAELFSLYACLPDSLLAPLKPIKAIQQITRLFSVEESFARKRLRLP
ncbi:ImmA/IrrE family metallo-endopeptidase [Bhargavaea cecembensis]|uniref:ImmA/IrrE family metallo-endopeptidase n=1 Tax=Bhargavaea cecembensis TaxID=394098 RepID=UPI0015CF7CAC|nr:ImmA/IrrE family metallo-endopeptidase [Bhargavaea cecembensis]